ncbi:MAG: two-component regulator propeller domain-containing protein [Flavobacteriales bacterium]
MGVGARIVAAALFVGVASATSAQDLRFQHLTTDDGLSDNAVTCAYEDRAGFIWIGTEHGLNRYDGNQVWQPNDDALRTEWITGIMEDGAGVFWVTTHEHGLVRYDPTTGTYRQFRKGADMPGSLASEQFNGLYDLNDTTVLLASREVSLIFLDKRTLTFSYWTDSLSLDPAKAVATPTGRRGWCHTIAPLDDDRLWLGFLNFQYTWVVDRHNLHTVATLVVRRLGSESQTCAALQGTALYTGGWQKGLDVLALPTERGAHVFATEGTRVIATPDEVTSIVPWGNGQLLASIRQNGLLLVDPVTGTSVRHAHSRGDAASIASDRVRCLFVDRSGILWAGTANGLDRCAPDVWNMHVQPLFNVNDADHSDLFFHRIEPEAGGGARLLTSEGIITTDAHGSIVRRTQVRANGMDLQPTVTGHDHDGSLLLGTEYGILRYNDLGSAPVGEFIMSDASESVYHPGGMFQVRGIWPDTVDTRPVYVIGATGFGAVVVDRQRMRWIGMAMPPQTLLVNTYSLVNDMVRDAHGTYWCASAGGIYHWNRRDLIAQYDITYADGTGAVLAAGEDVRRILLLGDTLWAVTRNGDLLRVIGNDLHRYTPPTHLRTAMQGLAADRRGMLWITTNDGLLRFDPRGTTFLHVPVNDGSMFRKLTRAITTLTDGRIAIGADNTCITFDPNAYDTLAPTPTPYLVQAQVAGRPIVITDAAVTLSYRASVIDIAISALAQGQPRPLLFEYRLDGVETDWRAITAHDAIRYAGVPVGTHPLLVRVIDAFGRTGPEHTLLTITVEAPFWLTWWFYALVAAAISAGVYAWSRYRIAQALKFQTVRNRIASDLHDEVGSSLSSITIGSQLASQLSSGENEKVKQLMARIGETSSESLRSMSDIVWAIDPKNDQGEALVKRMRRIASELLESKGIEVSFSVSGGVEDLKLPMNARKEIVLLYKEAVHNTSKYSGASVVQVSLHRRNGTLALSVKDDGKGFDVALHPDGHGLGSMHRRATSLGGRLTLTSAPGLGTLVGVEVDLTRIRD